MKYEQKSFTVPASSEKSPPDCRHGWIDAHGKCVLCGDPNPGEAGTQATGADMSTHDCIHQGHVWREGKRPANAKDYPQLPLYARHRISVSTSVAVFCQHCEASAELERKAGFSGVRRPGQPIDHTIPPQFKRVLARALAEAPPDTGSVPKP